MITEKLIQVLLKSALDSVAILERLEIKIDAQAIGKMRGAFRSLQTAVQQQSGSDITIQMALNSLTESAEYFRSLIKSIDSELDFDTKLKRRSEVGKFLGWGQIITGSVRDLFGLKGGQLNKWLLLEVKRIDCVNLLILSEIGRIACMHALNYNSDTIAVEFLHLRQVEFEVDSDPILDAIVDQGMLPSYIKSLEQSAFEQSYGAILNFSDVQYQDEWHQMRTFVIENYGSKIEEIKRNNPGYKSVCQQVGREAVDLDDYVNMVMQCADEDDDLIDKLFDWGEKKFLYWADKEMIYSWTEAFFRYAALRTFLAANPTPKKLLSTMSTRGFPGV